MQEQVASVVVQADPYAWPYDGGMLPAKTAILVIDMQRRVYEPNAPGWRALKSWIVQLLEAVRRSRGFTVIFARQGYRPDLADCPPPTRWRLETGGFGPPLVRGTSDWHIVAPLAPRHGEPVVDHPASSVFYGTDLDTILQVRGISNLILTGLTTDGAVHSTMREANDRGYECLLLEDCTGATDEGNYRAAIKMIQMQGGVFGAVSTSQAFIETMRQLVSW